MKKVISTILVALASINLAWAGARLNVSWQASNSTDVAGYKVYANGVVQADLNMPTATSWSGECPDCQDGNNTIGVSAYDAGGHESEVDVVSVSWDAPPSPPKIMSANITEAQ